MQNSFNEDYYERGISTGLSLYTNYRWIPELTIPMCHEIVKLVNIRDTDTVLDFGCSKGYVVKGFRLLHYEAWGTDISDYAINHAPEDVRQYLTIIQPGDPLPLPQNGKALWNVTVAKDVLEHVDYDALPGVLRSIRDVTLRAYVVVPLGDGRKYYVPSYEMDVTHKIRQPLDWWVRVFNNAGFHVDFADYRHGHIKENWVSTPNGNGFFILS